MKKQQFKTLIDASSEKVWHVLLGTESYPLWTAPFAEGSNVETDWKKGSKALFSDGSGSGMVSRIAENIPYKFLSIQHIGTFKDGVEDTESEQATQWSGFENYTLKSINGKTEWTVDVDVPEEYEDYFLKTWPSAMDIVKEISEK